MPDELKNDFAQHHETGQNTYITHRMSDYWDLSENDELDEYESMDFRTTEWLRSLGLTKKDEVLILVWW